MEILNIKLVYFSATYTTRKIVRLIAKGMNKEVAEHDITQSVPETDLICGKEELLIVGMPVYAGRIPVHAHEALCKFKGNNTPAVIVCVYGNRDYDDSLLEIKDIVEENGFKVISAGAFIAQHSIFPAVGSRRPDDEDIRKIETFIEKSLNNIEHIKDISLLAGLEVKGNRPYKTPGKIPLRPKGNRKCNECGICVKLCPEQAIPESTPRKTNKELCISCGRCIVVCPQKARHFGGLLYKIAGNKFTKANAARKEPECFFSNELISTF